jgi:hypothetical protein
MLRRLRSSFCFFSLFININILNVSIQSHTSELNSGSINSMIRWHDHGFSLFHDTTLRDWDAT